MSEHLSGSGSHLDSLKKISDISLKIAELTRQYYQLFYREQYQTGTPAIHESPQSLALALQIVDLEHQLQATYGLTEYITETNWPPTHLKLVDELSAKDQRIRPLVARQQLYSLTGQDFSANPEFQLLSNNLHDAAVAYAILASAPNFEAKIFIAQRGELHQAARQALMRRYPQFNRPFVSGMLFTQSPSTSYFIADTPNLIYPSGFQPIEIDWKTTVIGAPLDHQPSTTAIILGPTYLPFALSKTGRMEQRLKQTNPAQSKIIR